MSFMSRQIFPNRITLHESHFTVYYVAGVAIAQSAEDKAATKLTKLLGERAVCTSAYHRAAAI
jgi:hypothetical protein